MNPRSKIFLSNIRFRIFPFCVIKVWNAKFEFQENHCHQKHHQCFCITSFHGGTSLWRSLSHLLKFKMCCVHSKFFSCLVSRPGFTAPVYGTTVVSLSNKRRNHTISHKFLFVSFDTCNQLAERIIFEKGCKNDYNLSWSELIGCKQS